VFFFSSRRRHTRFSRDWSSDVCSSDLTGTLIEQLESLPAASREQAVARLREVEGEPWMREARYLALRAVDACVPADALDGRVARSEERRVGKEWTAARAGCHEKTKNTK